MPSQKVINFMCPDCDVDVYVSAAILTVENDVILVGACRKCKSAVKMDIQLLLTSLFDGGRQPGGN